MKDEHFKLIKRLALCTFLPGSWDKRFIRSLRAMTVDEELSEKQITQLERMHYRYRKQLGEPNLSKPECMKPPKIDVSKWWIG